MFWDIPKHFPSCINGTRAPSLVWFENDGQGNFGEEQLIMDESPWAVTAADFDHDGDVDIFCSISADESAVFIENQGGTNFAAPVVIASNIGVINNIHLVDIDDDDDLDVLTSSSLYDYYLLFKNTTDPISATNNINEKISITASPNPSAGNVVLRHRAYHEITHVHLYDERGALERVVSITPGQTETPIDGIPSGVFIGKWVDKKGRRITSLKINVQ